jgi:hypothetical protein
MNGLGLAWRFASRLSRGDPNLNEHEARAHLQRFYEAWGVMAFSLLLTALFLSLWVH